MTVTQLTEVWDPLSVVMAVIEGILFGYGFVGWFTVNPAYASGQASPREYGTAAALSVLIGGLIFFGGQIFGSWYSHDPQWTRVVSRYGVWVMFSIATGVGLTVRLTRHLSRKHAEIRRRAADEIEADR